MEDVKRAERTPIYAQVAFDMASKIASGEVAEGVRFTGRSLTSSRYGVSTETIRRAMWLLADMGVLEIRQNVGAVVKSRKRAADYVERARTDSDRAILSSHLRELVEQRDRLNQEIQETFQKIIDLEERFRSSDCLRTYEFILDTDSYAVGRDLAGLQFRQRTGGTVVALRREKSVTLSPGPDVELLEGDILVVACNVSDIDRVSALLREGVDQKEGAE